MDLKDHNVGKIIDNTASQLLSYLFPKKGGKEGSLADKPWIKKIRIISPIVALGLLVFMSFLSVIIVPTNPAGSGLIFILGVIFLVIILGCFAAIGISALFKRDGSIFYLYLLKASIWAFCGSLLFGGIGLLMSLQHKPTEESQKKAQIEADQRKTRQQEREARQKSYDELWEASGVSSSNSIGKLQKEIQLIEEYQKIIAEKDKKIQALEKALEERK